MTIIPAAHITGEVVVRPRGVMEMEDKGLAAIRQTTRDGDYGTGCKGYWTYSVDGNEFDCEYPYAGEISCEDCRFGACGGRKDPRVKRRR